jgi:ATP-dependent Lon protease
MTDYDPTYKLGPNNSGSADELDSQAVDEEVEFMPMISLDDDEKGKKVVVPDSLPILPLRNTVLFPGVVLPITVGRDRSIRAVRQAIKAGRTIGVMAQLDESVEDPGPSELHAAGTLAHIVKELRMADGSTTVIIQGKKRFQLAEVLQEKPYLSARVAILPDEKPTDDQEYAAIIKSIKDLAGRIIQLSPKIPQEAQLVVKNMDNPVFLMHFIASNLNREMADKQRILATSNLLERASLVLGFLNDEVQMLELQGQIHDKVKVEIEKQQRDYFLNQQLKTIQEELGGDSYEQELKELRERAQKMNWPEAASKAFFKDLEKLQRINPASAEYSVQRNYLELLLDLPWNNITNDIFDLARARKILDRDHFGLEKVKKRLLEYLAVLKLKGDLKSPILCLVGPPGVGKTSLGQSVAEALGRKYVRMSLGGLHDESEIRGHRKTYIGAMPGRILQSLKKVKSSNPVFILDEVDKVGKDFRGDPSSALLEVLDPEQNTSFYDNFLELEYDLSKVLFIATANDMASIQPALRDRMEIIRLSGYSTEEKVEIARRHLLPKQREAHGLKPANVKINPAALKKLVEDYTRESGVRELDRVLAAVMRHVATQVAEDATHSSSIGPDDIEAILGVRKYDRELYSEPGPAGVATGLAWTSVGGEILFVEASLSEGKGGMTLTGNLGDVMKESASTALSYLKAHANQFGLTPERFEKTSIHIHVPEGAIPKDGPSAGVTMLTALVSAFTGRKVKPQLAMTGEITLRGRVLPVGGIKEKILAAKRAGIKDILLCDMNRKDIGEIDPHYLKGLRFHYVHTMDEVLDKALRA